MTLQFLFTNNFHILLIVCLGNNPIYIYEGVGAYFALSFVTEIDSNMQFIIHTSRKAKKSLPDSLGVGAPVGGIHSIISVAVAKIFLST